MARIGPEDVWKAKHGSSKMRNVTNRRCKKEGCSTIAYFGSEGEKRGHSSKHCSSEEKDIVTPWCKKCKDKVQRENLLYRPHCNRCYSQLNPDSVKNYRKIPGEVSTRRPDGFLSFDWHCVIVEIDENQHTAYNSAGKNKREQDIIKDIQNTPIVFVRLNPDKYKSKSGKISNGFLLEKDEVQRRFDVLEKAVERQ
ncbi:hypothetical protein GQ600_14986 [Phytophthora cactorum]|nr:hypothetical protein GQ600_14986 [Phytophthora cactorum]